MSPRRPFVVAIAELARHPGARQDERRSGRVHGVALSSSQVADEDVDVDVTLEATASGAVTATGTVTGRWEGECRRCLEATGGDLTVELAEVFEVDPVEGETYPLGRDHVDLEPALREALALTLPLAPLCDEACPGPDPAGHPVRDEDAAPADGEAGAGDGGDEGAGDAPADPRWAALDQLRFDR